MSEKQKELELSGAASALKYLETSVQRAQKRLDEANSVLEQSLLNLANQPLDLDGSDFEVAVARARAEVKDAEDSLLRFSKVMLDYDKNVDTSRRDVSEQITRNEAEKIFFSFAICMRGGVEQIATRISQDSMELKCPEDTFKIIAPLMRECFFSALRSATDENQIPSWVRATIEGAL